MGKSSTYKTIKIRKRPFYIWFLRVLWFAWLLFWLDAVKGSHQEWELRALKISLAILLISFLLGMILWILGIRKARKN